MSETVLKPPQELSWEALRQRASALNVPAWKLAEELAFHERDGELVFIDSSIN